MSEDVPLLPRRERQKAERKARIFEAAIKFFSEKGFRNTTMKEIADAADVGEGTIYSYFKSKDDLLIAILDQLTDWSSSIITQTSLEEDYHHVLLTQICGLLHRLESAFPMYAAVLPEILTTPALREHFYNHVLRTAIWTSEKHFEARIKRGHLRQFDVSLVVRLFTAMKIGIPILMFLGDSELQKAFHDPDRVAETMARLMLDGISPKADQE